MHSNVFDKLNKVVTPPGFVHWIEFPLFVLTSFITWSTLAGHPFRLCKIQVLGSKTQIDLALNPLTEVVLTRIANAKSIPYGAHVHS